jgi:Spy/CpxP family protein refolding chaperone
VKRWWLVIVLLLSLGVNVGIVAALVGHRWAGEATPKGGDKEAERLPEERPGPQPGGQNEEVPQRIVRLANQLGLEGDQRKKFISLQGSFFADTLRLRTDQAETQRELRRALGAPVPDQARIDSLLQESGNTFTALEKAMTTNVLESRKLLKPDQERKFLKLLARLRLGPGPGGQGGGQGQPEPQGRPRRQQPPPPPPPPQREGPPPQDDMDGPSDRPPGGPEAQEPPPQNPRGQADGAPFRQRRPLGPRARRFLRRFGGGQGQGRRLQGQPPPPGTQGSPP